MPSQEDFYQFCDDLNKRFLNAKKDLSQTKKIGQFQIIQIEQEIANSPKLGCANGCSHCCHLRVVAFPHELITIYLHIKLKFEKNHAKAIFERIRNQYEIVQNMSIEEHFTTNVECPLLENGRCSVYEVRPVACAGYHSGTEEACRISNENPEILGTDSGGIPMLYGIQEMSSLQNSAIKQVIDSKGDDSEQYELIKGLFKIFSDPTVNQRWIRGRKFFK
jgi:Fe-S-cluster containining protein